MINRYNAEKKKGRGTTDTFHGWSSNSATEVVENFSETNPVLIVLGYLLMLAYCAFAFSRLDWVRSHAGAGMVRGREERAWKGREPVEQAQFCYIALFACSYMHIAPSLSPPSPSLPSPSLSPPQVGLLLVVLSVVGALGFCSYIGIAFNATSLHVRAQPTAPL